MATKVCPCQSDCAFCGPLGSGCDCPKNQCNCNKCVNKAHSSKVWKVQSISRVWLTRR
ncbi:hypothetical protein F5I97DRAFT_1903759 [Phlebopus sp. FC_14]|nr:hypothetical protein F5I97DRAFT_1903759 [Phlebopus sp. FC_14]